MPYRDPEKRRQKAREYTKKYNDKKRPEHQAFVTCSVIGCSNLTDGKHRKCEHHLAYMREYKKKYRVQERSLGTCSNTDCIKPARQGFKLCEECNERSKARGKLPEVRDQIKDRNLEIKKEVLRAYGDSCVCCGEERLEFLSIDHIEGFSEGPRSGTPLYRWLKRNNFPPGFRTLCMSCNFALGHHGYCPHGSLTQITRVGRPTDRIISDEDSATRRALWIQYKLRVFAAYGGTRCACCGDTSHERLSIDHINNDGAKHRKTLEDSSHDRNICVWLSQNNFPPGFQILCINCNWAKRFEGYCPHDSERHNPCV